MRAAATTVAVAFAFVGGFACNPSNDRPAFQPFPQSVIDTIAGDPESVIQALAEHVGAEGIDIKRLSIVDAYLETERYDVEGGRRSAPNRTHPERVIVLRFWADVVGIRLTAVTAEVTHPRTSDPSLPPRLAEMMARPGHPGLLLLRKILDDVKEELSG